MAKIEGFRIRNFKSLRDVTLGSLCHDISGEELTQMTAVIGRNGGGKSSLVDAFCFLSDCLRLGVEEACAAKGRGGFGSIVSLGVDEPISLEMCYLEGKADSPVTYEISIALNDRQRPCVLNERLDGEHSLMHLENGRGFVRRGEETEEVELEDTQRLGIATFGAIKQYSRISALRQFIEGWYLSYFSPEAARGLSVAGPQRHLNIHGDNIGNVVQFMEMEYPERLREILSDIAGKIPGVERVATEQMPDGRLLLKFGDKDFVNTFSPHQMSDGTLKLFAYLFLLSDPNPPPFLLIEEPENGLYHKLLEALIQQLRDHAEGSKTQVFITTHHPYLVDALDPEEVWVLERGRDGFAEIRRASDYPEIQAMVEEGVPLGGLWYSDYLEEV